MTSAEYVTILEGLAAFLAALPGASALEGLQPVGSWIQPAASADP